MNQSSRLKAFLAVLIVLLAVLGFVFSRSFSPNLVLFSNDGPLGAISAASANMQTAWRGIWKDLDWIGIEAPAALPNTAALSWFVLGNSAISFSKFHVPLALLG